MNYEFRIMSEEHRKPVIDIFNYFIENGFAAYLEEKVPYEFFSIMLHTTEGYPAIVIIDKDAHDKIAGFAFMRPYHPMKSFRRTAELSYFLLPEYTKKGIGNKIMAHFIAGANELGIDSLLADISSLNEPSIKFHEKMGFERCGCFKRAGRKSGKDFDVVWMQKLL